MLPDRLRKPLHYDSASRRVWICGQRCHHGATGALLAAAGMLGVTALKTPLGAAFMAAGSVLMLHDWKDRDMWFQRGWQQQP